MTVEQILEKTQSYEEVQIRYACFDTLIYQGPAYEVPDEIGRLYVELIYCSVASPSLVIEAYEPIDIDPEDLPDVIII